MFSTENFGFISNATRAPQPLLTPNYPNLYPNEVEVEWILTSASELQVELTIVSGETQSCCDKLEVCI